MKTSPTGIVLIKTFEGFSRLPYRCPAGYLTVGYGHVLRDKQLVAVDEVAAELLLVKDACIAEAAISRLIARPLAQHQFDALVSFTFNLGAGALQRSALRRCIQRGEDAAAAQQFLRWVYAGSRVLPGLVARRRAESRMFSGD